MVQHELVRQPRQVRKLAVRAGPEDLHTMRREFALPFPAVGLSRHPMRFNRVVFPLPDGPTAEVPRRNGGLPPSVPIFSTRTMRECRYRPGASGSHPPFSPPRR